VTTVTSSDGRPRSVVRLIHTSDLHIAGEDGSLEALRAIIDSANGWEVDLVLIAGDLFDSGRVPENISDLATAALGRCGRPVVVIPGNHDCVDERSLYHRIDLTRGGEHVHFVGDPKGRQLVFDELGVEVWARGIEVHDPRNRPLDGYTPARRGYWSVGLVHGHYVARAQACDRSSQITQDEIAELDCDYLALGHWHRFLDVSDGGTTAYYSGSPSEPRHKARTVNLVTLDPAAGVLVERRSIDSEEAI
jgi:exonuclease SbcD